jgi:histidine triad (HIT) family protein
MRIPEVLLRSWIILKITGLFFNCAGLLMPGKRLCETKNWMAVQHPKPAYPVHILLIPKKAISDWLSFPTDEAEMFSEFVHLSQRLIREEGLATKGYRLIINGGEYQSIPQLHVHLVSGEPKADQ